MKRLLSSVCALFFSTLTAQAQITYHDISPDTTIAHWEAFSVFPPALNNGQLVIWYHPTPEVLVRSMGNWEVLFDGTLPAKLNLGDSIALGSGTWKQASYDALNSGGKGHWQTSASDKYLAFRYKNTAGYNYGWLKMSVAAGASSFTVKEYAYNTMLDQKIIAGQAATTSAAGLRLGDDLTISISNRQLRLFADASRNYQLAVVDMAGRVVRRSELKGGQAWSLDELSAGSYLIHVAIGGYTKAFQLAIQ